MYYVGKCCVNSCGGCIEGSAKACGYVFGGWQKCCLNMEQNCVGGCKCCGQMAGSCARMCGENCQFLGKLGCETCSCCLGEYAAGPFTICNLFIVLLYAVPGILWVVLACMQLAGSGSECSSGNGLQGVMLLIQGKNSN